MGTFIRTPIYYQLSDSEARSAAADPSQPARDSSPDSLITKILKYVPAEVIAAFTGAVAFFSSQNSISDNSKQLYTLALLLIGLIGAPAYFLYSSWIETDPKNKPAKYFFLFSFFCFPVWALVTSSNAREAIAPFTLGPIEWSGKLPFSSRKMTGVDSGDAEIALFIIAFIVPVIDQGLTRILARQKASKDSPRAGMAPQPEGGAG